MGTSQKQALDKLTLAVDKYVTAIWIETNISYTWLQALRDAGYSETYAKSDCAKLWNKAEQLLAERKEKLVIRQKWDLVFVDEQYRTLLDNCILVNDRTNAKGCLDSMSRRLSGFTDNINSKNELVNELSEQETAILEEAASQAKLKLSKTA